MVSVLTWRELTVYIYSNRIYLAVQTKSQEHKKEQDGPQGADRHLCNGFWVAHEGKARTYYKLEKNGSASY